MVVLERRGFAIIDSPNVEIGPKSSIWAGIDCCISYANLSTSFVVSWGSMWSCRPFNVFVDVSILMCGGVITCLVVVFESREFAIIGSPNAEICPKSSVWAGIDCCISYANLSTLFVASRWSIWLCRPFDVFVDVSVLMCGDVVM